MIDWLYCKGGYIVKLYTKNMNMKYHYIKFTISMLIIWEDMAGKYYEFRNEGISSAEEEGGEDISVWQKV